MNVLVVTPPEPLVTLAEAKVHCRVTHDHEDTLIAGYAQSASAHIDGPFGVLKRAVMPQTLEVRAHVFSALDRLPCGPVQSIESVRYINHTGTEALLDDTVYGLNEDRVHLASGARWPAVRGDAAGIRVRYVAGFDAVPAALRQAALLLIGQWYAVRMPINVGNIVSELPHGVRALLAPYKIWRF